MTWLKSLILSAFISAAAIAQAQEILPEHRYLMSRDVDFFGADLGRLFDASEAACARACSAQDTCVGYTFNTRNGACFPKSEITEWRAYSGALSARKVRTASDFHARAAERLADLGDVTAADLDAARTFVRTNARR
ncbi:MAG: PAN/Apple domain-containing protein [Pseudomonadota bacterium]